MSEGLDKNPFAALFPTLAQAEQFRDAQLMKPSVHSLDHINASAAVTDNSTDPRAEVLINAFLERVFLITLDENGGLGNQRPASCLFLEDLFSALGGQQILTFDVIGQALFERLMLAEPKDYVARRCKMSTDTQLASEAGQASIVDYLCESYCRLYKDKADNEVPDVWLEQCEMVLLDNGKLCLQMPSVFGDAQTRKQMASLLHREGFATSLAGDYLVKVCSAIEANPDEGTLQEVVWPTLKKIKSHSVGIHLGQTALHDAINTSLFFTKSQALAKVFMQFNSNPREIRIGKDYMDSLLGSFLTVSCLPRTEVGPYEFFDHPAGKSKQEHDITEQSIHQPTGLLNEHTYQLVYGIIKLGGEPRQLILQWISNCLHSNKDRAKLWTREMPMMSGAFASDGFFVNLCAILLRLCKPFAVADSARLLKIDATYTLATGQSEEEKLRKNVHGQGLAEATCLVPRPEGEAAPTLDSHLTYSFVTECFFLCHQALNIGIHTLQERFMKLNQDLHRAQGAYRDIVEQGGAETDLGRRIKDQVERGNHLLIGNCY